MRSAFAPGLAAVLLAALGCAPQTSEKVAAPSTPPAAPAPRPGTRVEYKPREWVRPPIDANEWKVLDSGLQVWDAKEGTGEAVKPGGTVVIHYVGWLTDSAATEFDSSVRAGEPAEFGLAQLIPAWQEGIPGMKPGGIRRLKVPPKLGYGVRGTPDGKIPPNSQLVFEIELIEVK